MGANDALVRLDLNNPVFQETLFNLQKAERHAAIDTLKKIRLLTWAQVYRDHGLKWEKIVSIKPPAGRMRCTHCALRNHAGPRLGAMGTSCGC